MQCTFVTILRHLLAGLILSFSMAYVLPAQSPPPAGSAGPCLYIGDLDFGALDISKATDSARTLPLQICNQGTDTISFDGSTGNPLIWSAKQFSVPKQELDALTKARLGPGECMTIHVTFHALAVQTGTYRTVARLTANTQTCRDTSVWTAIVGSASPQISGYDWTRRLIGQPGDTSAAARYSVAIPIRNTGTIPFDVESLTVTGSDAAFFEIDTTDSATTVHPGTSVAHSQTIYQKISFHPTAPRYYHAQLVLNTTAGTTTAFLDGIGIYRLQISGLDLGVHPFDTSAGSEISGTLRISTTISGDQVVVEDVQIRDIGEPSFSIKTLPGHPVTLYSDTTMEVGIRFAPLSPGLKTAFVDIIGTNGGIIASGVLQGETTTGTTDAPFPIGEAGGKTLLLDRNQPNPFVDQTSIRFTTFRSGTATLDVFNAAGERLERLLDGPLDTGSHTIEWNATTYPTGIYYYRLVLNGVSAIGGMIIER